MSEDIMGDAVEAAYRDGRNAGYDEGFIDGREQGLDRGYEAGYEAARLEAPPCSCAVVQ